MAPGVASLRGVVTGKGLAGGLIAAQYLATARRMDLYRIDLSSVVSKYIVETEDQMRRVFYVAEKIGAIHFRRSGYAFIATTITPSSRSTISCKDSRLLEASRSLPRVAEVDWTKRSWRNSMSSSACKRQETQSEDLLPNSSPAVRKF